MELFLVQHGHAMAKAQDPDRPLTPEGAETVRRMARWARDAGLTVAAIHHSGKLRAEQTAQLLADELTPSQGVSIRPGLAPNDDVAPVARGADELAGSMVVGHLPFLSRLTALLVAGDPETIVVRFRNAGIICLGKENGDWSVSWVMR